METILVKDLPDYEQLIDIDRYSVSNSRVVPKKVYSVAGEIFYKLITQHPGIFLQLQKEGEDSAGRAFYQELDATKLVEKAAEVATLAADTITKNGWIYPITPEIEAKNIAKATRKLKYGGNKED